MTNWGGCHWFNGQVPRALTSGAKPQQLAVLTCEVSPAEGGASGAIVNHLKHKLINISRLD